MVGLVSARHTYCTFVFRYTEYGGKRLEYDLTVDLVHIPPVAKDPLARDPRMESLDPNEWKKQDHYVVLGMEEKRGEVCTPDDVRNAYRARVLVYHPDKIAQRNGKGKGKSQKDDAIFKCIQKAFEVLNDPDRKASFDSVDPTFDDSIPTDKCTATSDFYATFGPVFERNMRFSKKKSGLVLGGKDTPRDQVEAFYQFWFDFDSVRRFDYLDEDDCENGENRADKRWQEKKNKAARAKRKTEDNARVRTLAENAYKADPRVKAFKEEDKQAKLNRKNNKSLPQKGNAVSCTDAEAKKKAEAELAARAAAAAQEAAQDAKKAKEAEASAVRRERKALKTLFVENNYFLPDGLDAATKLKHLEEEATMLEQVCSKLGRLEIAAVREQIEREAGVRAATNILREHLGVAQIDRPSSPVRAVAEKMKPVEVKVEPICQEWTLHDVDLLINGTKKFPGGTRNRWETIAEWFNRQAAVQRTVDDILKKAQDVKSSAVAGMVASPLESEPLATGGKRDPRIDQNEPTVADAAQFWTADEQSALEKAMKSVPAADAQRWDAIAALVPTRTKKECMLRAKELAAMLKSKKVA